MKHLIIIIFLFALNNLHSQGNLQFNQVLRVSNTPQTVPVGKVWKVESYLENEGDNSPNYATGCTNLGYHRPLTINNYNYYFVGSIAYGNTAFVQLTNANKLPVWLKAGDIIKTTCIQDFASVVLPHCRGPWTSTTGVSERATFKALSASRGSGG
jgi:hypothetical protein